MISRLGRMLLAGRKQSGGVGINIIPPRSSSSFVVYAREHVVRSAAGGGGEQRWLGMG